MTRSILFSLFIIFNVQTTFANVDTLLDGLEIDQIEKIETVEQFHAVMADFYETELPDVQEEIRQEMLSSSSLSQKQGFNIPLSSRSDLTAKNKITLMLAAAVFLNEKPVTDKVQGGLVKSKSLAKVGDLFGGTGAVVLPLGAYALGFITKSADTQSLGRDLIKATLISGVVVEALKLSFHRHRPNDSESAYRFDGPDLLQKQNRSFPSGHTAAAFAMATVIADHYRDQNKLVPVVAYSLATITAWSRVHDRAHWVSDTMVGGLIGYWIAQQVLARNSGETNSGMTILPSISLNGEGVINVRYVRPIESEMSERHFSKCRQKFVQRLGRVPDLVEEVEVCFSSYIEKNWER